VSTLDGRACLRTEITVPPSGAAYADITLVAGGALPALGPATLVFLDLTFRGAVTRVGEDDPGKPRVVFEVGAGWGRALPRAGSYKAPGGVSLLTVLRDLAGLATYPGGPATGEAYDAPADVTLPSYAWAASAPRLPVYGRTVLADLVTRGHLATWRVDPSTGNTRFNEWPAIGAADAAGVLLSPRNLERGMRRYGLASRAAAFLPGATVEGVTVRRVIFHETAKAAVARCYDR
jgi:hypothetical protein